MDEVGKLEVELSILLQKKRKLGKRMSHVTK